MLLGDFRTLVGRLWDEIPEAYRAGIVAVEVSPAARAHPGREAIYTLGECIPLPGEAGPGGVHLQSRIVLYHGSFAALAAEAPGYDWVGEAWETLTHELRHHLEWKAEVGDLEAWDEAAEHNFARREGDRFDPLFYLVGRSLPDDAYQLDDDVFFDRRVARRPETATITWGGLRYAVAVPADATLPAFLTLRGLADPPPGEAILVLRRRSSLRSLLDRRPPYRGEAEARSTGRG